MTSTTGAMDQGGATVEKDPVGASEHYDVATITKSLCMAGLLCTWLAGITCCIIGSGAVLKPTTSAATTSLAAGQMVQVFGSYHNFHNWPLVHLSPTAAELLPLLLNAIITLLIESVGLIHATTLRWSLGKDLLFNSNLRLFTSSRAHLCLRWPANVLHASFLVLSYTASSMMFPTSPPQEWCNSQERFSITVGLGCGDTVVLSTPAVLCLGIALLGQAALATWQVIAVPVPTWSANPLDTAWASSVKGAVSRVSGRCMASVHDAKADNEPKYPVERQKSIYRAHRQARRVLWYLYLSMALSFLWFLVIFFTIKSAANGVGGVRCNNCNRYQGTNWSIIPFSGSVSPIATAILAEATVSAYAGLVVLSAVVQSFLTLALHCAELLTTLSRDEATWRKTNTNKPYNPRPNALLRAALSWEANSLFILKIVLHWLFSTGFKYQYNWGIFMRPPALLYLTIGAGTLAGFGTFISFRRRKGEQPATFGHIQTLVDLVDEWHLLMYWGDKTLGEGEGGGVRHAGTAGEVLGEVRGGSLYA